MLALQAKTVHDKHIIRAIAIMAIMAIMAIGIDQSASHKIILLSKFKLRKN